MQWHRKLQKKRETRLSTLCENELQTGNDAINCTAVVLHVMKSTAKVWRSTLFGSYSFDYYPRYCCTWVESLYQKPPANSFPICPSSCHSIGSFLGYTGMYFDRQKLFGKILTAAYRAAFLSAHCGKLLYSDKKLRSLSGLIILAVSNLVLSWMFYS